MVYGTPAGKSSIISKADLAPALMIRFQLQIRCGCGGSYIRTGTPKGAASWRNHMSSDRHMEWEYGPDGTLGGGRGRSDREETERKKSSQGSIKFEAKPEKVRRPRPHIHWRTHRHAH